MDARHSLEMALTHHLGSRGLRRTERRLAFMHNGTAVALEINSTIYRGYYVAIWDRGEKLVEFRAGHGGFDWDAIAAAVMATADRLAEERDRRACERNELAIAGLLHGLAGTATFLDQAAPRQVGTPTRRSHAGWNAAS